MTKWAVVTVLLYIALVVVVFLPPLWWLIDTVSGQTAVFTDYLKSLTVWQFWFFVAVIILIQAALLFFPVRTGNLEFKPQRAIWVPLVTTVFLLSILLLGMVWSVTVALHGDDVLTSFFLWAGIIFFVINWFVWFCIFLKLSRKIDPVVFSNKLTDWLIKGSIIELLIAVPCHIIVRRRNECCAPGITFLGITAGVVIMALAFGPAIYLLVKSRLQKYSPPNM